MIFFANINQSFSLASFCINFNINFVVAILIFDNFNTSYFNLQARKICTCITYIIFKCNLLHPIDLYISLDESKIN